MPESNTFMLQRSANAPSYFTRLLATVENFGFAPRDAAGLFRACCVVSAGCLSICR